MLSEEGFSDEELIVIQAARLIKDGKTVFPGTGLPILAAILAKKLYAPNLVLIFATGAIDSDPIKTPISAIESRTIPNSLTIYPMEKIYNLAQIGYLDYALVGGAQVDIFGNLNSTVIGEYKRPKIRLTGSGAANDITSLAWSTIIMIRQDEKRFVEKVDFVTSPGYLNGGESRYQTGLPKDTGPKYVVTQYAVYEFSEKTRRLKIYGIYEHVNEKEFLEKLKLPIEKPKRIKKLKKPSEKEIRTLRKLNIEKFYFNH